MKSIRVGLAILLGVVSPALWAAPAYTLRGFGTSAVDGSAAAITPGAISGVQNGDREFMVTGERAASVTPTITNNGGGAWTVLGSQNANGTLYVYTRVHQSGDSAPTVDWDGSSPVFAQLFAFGGSVYTDDATVLDATTTTSGGNTSALNYAAITPASNNSLVLVCARKNKTSTSNGVTVTIDDGFTEILQTATTNTANMWACGFIQQTTATAVGAENWAVSIAETLARNAISMAIKTQATPTFTSAPAIGTRTTSSIPINFTSDTAGTVYGVRCPDGQAAPTAVQVAAGNCTGDVAAIQSWNEPVAATVADSHAFSSITDGTLSDGSFVINSGTPNYSAVAAIADMYKLPAFTVNPTVSAQSDVAYTLSKTLDGPGTVYAVACKKDASAPSVTDVEAAHCASASAPEASANDDATGTFALGSALALPIYDLYVVGTYGSQHEAAVHTLADEMLDAPTGYQYITLASIGTGGPCESFNTATNPDLVAGDILKAPTTTSPGSYALTISTACQFSYSGDASRQSALNIGAYDISAFAYHSDDIDFWSNNLPPIPPEPDSLTFFVPLNSAMTPVDLTPYCTDPEGDAITVTNVSALPTGLSISSSTLQGTATVRGKTLNIQLKCTDITGDSVTWQ